MKGLTAGELMTPSPGWCTPSDPLEAAARLMAEYDCGALPVVDSVLTRRPVGVITDRDIVVRVVAVGRSPAECLVHDAMTPRAIQVHLDTPFVECARVMGERAVRRLLVVDDRGHVAGMVTDGDLARACQGHPEREHALSLLVEQVSDPIHPLHPGNEDVYASPVMTGTNQLSRPNHVNE